MPEPVSGCGICHLAPRAKDQDIYIYKCIESAIFVHFCRFHWYELIRHLSIGTHGERPGYIYM